MTKSSRLQQPPVEGSGRKLLQSGYLEVGLASVLVSTVGPLVKIIALPVPVIALGRFAVGWLALAAVRLARNRPEAAAPPAVRGRLVLIGCCTAGGLLCFMTSFRHIPVAEAVLIGFSCPVITVMLAHRFLGERVRPSGLLALFLAALGVILIVLPSAQGNQSGSNWIGQALAFAGAWIGAFEIILMKQLSGSVRAETVNLYRSGTAAVLVVPLALFSQPQWQTRDVLLVGMMGLIQNALAGTIYIMGLRKAKVHGAAILSYLEPLSAVLLAWFFLAEQPTLFTVLGGGLILAGSYIVIRSAVAGTPAGTLAEVGTPGRLEVEDHDN